MTGFVRLGLNSARSPGLLIMKIFYIVPAWSDQASQCRIVTRQVDKKIDAAASYRAAPELWKEAGLMNSQGKLVCLNDQQAFIEMSQDEPLAAGVQYSFPEVADVEIVEERAVAPRMNG